MCDAVLPSGGPTTYRLTVPAPGHVRWTVDGTEVASATERDGRWDVTDADTGHVAVTIIPAPTVSGPKVALVDHRARLVATFDPTGVDAGGIGLVLDSYERLVLAVRSDGPTGVHVIDADGNVLALASQDEDAEAIDVLVTGAGAARTETLVFGVVLALQLLRTGQLV